MPTFAKLTKVLGGEKLRDVWVNLDAVRTIQRVPAVPETEFHRAMPERTRLEYAQQDDDPYASHIDVVELPDVVVEKARMEAGWCR